MNYECFEDIYDNIITKGIPLNRENLRTVKTHGLITRVRYLERGKIQMSEEEFDHLCNEL